MEEGEDYNAKEFRTEDDVLPDAGVYRWYL